MAGQLYTVPFIDHVPTVTELKQYGLHAEDYEHNVSPGNRMGFYCMASVVGSKVAFGYYTSSEGYLSIYAAAGFNTTFNFYSTNDLNTGIFNQTAEIITVDSNSFYFARRGWIYNGGSFSNPELFVELYENEESGLMALSEVFSIGYPITYSYTNSTVSGPSRAVVGDTVTVSAVPDVGYGITDASTQILVTNNDVAVPYTWDATNQRITFTMPQPT